MAAIGGLRGAVSMGDPGGVSDLVGGLFCGTIVHLICFVPGCGSGCSRLLYVACLAGFGPVTVAGEVCAQGGYDSRLILISAREPW
jgi:hypothetical protein